MRIFAYCEARSLHLAIDRLIFTLPLQHAQPCDSLEEFRERQELHLGEIDQVVARRCHGLGLSLVVNLELGCGVCVPEKRLHLGGGKGLPDLPEREIVQPVGSSFPDHG